MRKLLLIILISIIFNSFIQGQFVVKDVLAVQPQASLFDPEYNPELNIVCWKSAENDLWISGLDPVTHLFEPSDGKGTLVTGNLAPNGTESWNGPEWMLSTQGTQIVYIKSMWGIRYPGVATKVFNDWQCFTLFQYPYVEYAMATSNYADTVARFLFETADNEGIYWLRNTDFGTLYHYPDVTLGFFARDNQQICCATNKARNPGFIETICNLPYFTIISDDTIGAPFMWNDPLTHKRLFMYRTNGFKTLKIYQEIAPDFWVLYNQFNSPLPEPFIYITSPEPFTCGGNSYVSFMAAQSSSGKDGLPAQIWIAAADPENSLMRRVSDSTLGIRTDPEPVVFGDSAFVYYTDVIVDKNSQFNYNVRKCDTGLGTLFTPAKERDNVKPGITVFPNPGNGRFKISVPELLTSGSVVKVYDLSGHLVHSIVTKNESPELNLTDLPDGSYLLKILHDKLEAVTKITIIH